MINQNTFLSDLKVGDLVREQYKLRNVHYLSQVTAIEDSTKVDPKVTVIRDDGTTHQYGLRDGMIRYPYGTQVPDWYLQQETYMTEGTPFNPGPVAKDAEVLIPSYGE